MHYDYIGALEVTYGNALAAGGGFHRVTTAEGSAAEVTPNTYLWYKLTTSTGSSSSMSGGNSSASGRLSPAAAARKQLSASSSSATSSGNDGAETVRGITQLRIEAEDWSPPPGSDFPAERSNSSSSSNSLRDSAQGSRRSSRVKGVAPKWTRMDKPIDRQRGLFVWYQNVDWQGPPSLSSSASVSSATSTPSPPPSTSSAGGAAAPSSSSRESNYPLKEIRVVRDVKDIPEGFEYLPDPIVNSSTSNGGKELRTYLCYRRLSQEDFASSKWSITTQKAGNWIEVKDISATKWSIGQIISISPTEIRVSISTWKKGRDEYLARATCRNRVAKLGTNVNLYMSPSYPFTRKQGSMWNAGLKDLQQAREDFDQFFYDLDNHETYLPRHLIPFVEKSLLCMFFSSEMAEDMNSFHQHVLKNLIAKLLSNDTSPTSSDPIMMHLLALLRMILNGHNSCMYFYIKYPGTYSATKYQKLVYTSYLASPDVLGTIPSRHPCRSFYFVDNVDLFLQAGGFRVILQRLALREIALREVALFCSLLYQAKPCLVQHKRRRSSSSKRRSTSAIDTQVEDFFRDFLNATFARLRRMNGEELKDDEGLVDHIVGMLDMLYRDGVLLGGSNGSISESDPDEYSGYEGPSSSVFDVFFAEAIEVFHLDLSKKLICCPFLAQRLLGIARLNDLIAMAQRREDLQKKTNLGMRRSSSSASGSFLGGNGDLSSASAGNPPVAKWLRVKYVVEWLSTSDVLEAIMGDKDTCVKYELQEGTHLEILKRSKKIYEFVAVNGLLNEKHIVLLWRTGMNQLRSGRKAVFDMLITLCGVISADLIDVVMVLLTQVPLSEYDELFTQFVRRIIMIASKQVVEIEASGTKKTLSSLVGVTGGSKLSSSAQKDVDVLNKVVNLGCCLLWNGILDGHDMSSSDSLASSIRPAMRSEVETVLAASLNYIQKLWAAANSSSPSSKEQQKLLSEYLKKCADNIKSGVLVETSMSLIQRVADGYGNEANSVSAPSSIGLSLPRAASFGSSRTSASPSDLLKDLNSKFGIIVVVAEEIKNYMASSRGSRDLSSHERSMRRRLSFLGYIVTRSEVELSYALMEQVWKCFNGVENTSEEREVFFEWFTSVIPDPSNFVHRAYSGNSAFASSVTTEIYLSLTRKPDALDQSDIGIYLDVKNMGKHAFWAFERLFRLINTNERAISSTGATGTSQRTLSVGASNQDEAKGKFVVESFDLKGLETLYEIALCAGSEDVSQEAINYLIYLHMHVGTKLVRREVWADYIRGCFERLEQKKASDIDKENAEQVHRLLVLLGTFLFQSVVQSNEALHSGGGLKDGPEELVVHVRTQDGRSAVPFRYQLRRTSLVGELRDRIAKDTGHPADRIRIVNEFKTKLTAQGHDKFTLEKARVFSSALPSALPSTAKISSASTAPVSSNGQHKRVNYVEAIMLSKVESDTVGHVQRPARESSGSVVKNTAGGAIAGAENDWHALKSDISSNERHLQLLFALLSQRVEICEEAWKVLKLLAADSGMEKRTRTLNDALGIDGSIRTFPASFDWDAMLDLSCSPKLLYQLELVERFAMSGDARSDAESTDDDEATARKSTKGVDGMIGTVNRWSESFLKLGGKSHLQKFVLTCNPRELVSQGSLSVMCMSKLLKLLRHFVLVEFRLAEQEEEPLTGDPEDLMHQLLEILSSLKALEENRIDSRQSFNEETQNIALSQNAQGGDAELAYSRPVLEDPDNIFALPSEAYLMTRTLSFIATCALTATQDALPLLESYSSHGQIFLNCLVKSRFKPVRQESASLIAALSTTRNKTEQDRIACCHYFLKLLSEYDGPVFDEEYYNVFTLLVSSADTLSEFAILPACRTLCRRVKSFSVSDDHAAGSLTSSTRDSATSPSALNQDAGSPDSLLEALLSTLLAILKRIPAVLAGRLDVPYRGRSLREVVASTLHEDEGIIDEIFHKCLFATPDNSQAGGGDQEETGSIAAQAPSSQYYLQKPKCRSDSSREVAFALLTELSQENTSGLRYLLEQMSSQHSLRAPPVPKNLLTGPPLSASKRKSAKSAKEMASRYQVLERAKYVGLKNLGCTCYMNSTMQSFFMIPRFRRQILRFNAESGSSISPVGSGEEKGVLYELQSLFAHLEGTAKPYYNPKSFTSALKTWDGESIDVNVQQDASEFLTSFFQQIESEMNGVGSGHGDESILNTFFGGVFSNELVAEGGRYSERAEPFHFISVPVRDRKNLKESLDGWVEGEKVSYTWEKSSEADQDGQQQGSGSMSGEKVTLDTHKRISISKLPDQLIIHLKRFEFDFERMQQIKLHDRFEFPMELDMYPYTKEGQEEKRKRLSSVASLVGVTEDSPDGPKSGSSDGRTTAPEYSQYELVGTVVHMGTANSGHYYSFLREQDTRTDASQWFEFNDTIVSPFDPQQIPDECFGGEDDRQGFAPAKASSTSSLSSSPSPTQRMKTRSSFMLFYARKKPKLPSLLGQPKERGSESDSTGPLSNPISFAACGLVLAFCAKLKRASRSRLEGLRSVAQVIAPEPIRNLIAMENRLFWRKKYLYDARCLSFTYEIIKSCLVGLDGSNNALELPRFEPTEARLVALQTATKFVFGTLWQGGDVSKVLEWTPALLALYHTEFDGCYWLLNTLRANEQLLLDLLVFNEHTEVRELLASVLSEAIATTSNLEFEEDSKAAQSGDSSGRDTSRSGGGSKKLPASFEFIFFLIQLMPALLSVPVQHHRQYFMTIWDFVQTGRNEGAFLVVNSVVGAIVALLTGLGNTQPLLQGQLKRYKSRQILKSIDLSVTVLKLLSVLIRCSMPPAMDVGKNFLLPPNMAHDHVDLTASDHEVLLNERFITLLTQRASRYSKETKPLEQIVIHLCWESRKVTGMVMDKIMTGIEFEDHHDVKPYFRTFNTILKLRDSLTSERLTDGMTKLIAVMASQQRFYKATEISIDMLTRLAKRHSSVARWLQENHMSCAWMEKWLSGHRGAEGFLQQKRTVLVKPNSTSNWANVNVTGASLIKTIDRTVSKLLPRIRSILDPQAAMETFYDSDDNPARLVGKRIRVKWAKDKWYEGSVERYDESSFEHFVVYDDGDKRSYRMSEKQFYVVESSGKVSPPSSGGSSSKKK